MCVQSGGWTSKLRPRRFSFVPERRAICGFAYYIDHCYCRIPCCSCQGYMETPRRHHHHHISVTTTLQRMNSSDRPPWYYRHHSLSLYTMPSPKKLGRSSIREASNKRWHLMLMYFASRLSLLVPWLLQSLVKLLTFRLNLSHCASQ
jgi:hypothetical protein